MTFSQSIFILAAIITTAVAVANHPASFMFHCTKAEDSQQDQIEGIPEVHTHQEQETSNAQLLEKITQLQHTVEDLRASNGDLRAWNMELARRIGNVEMSVEECQRSCADGRVLLNATLTPPSSNASTTTAVPDTPSTSPAGTSAVASSPLLTPTAISAERREFLSSALYRAAIEGNAERIRQLAAEGGNVYCRDEQNFTALHRAAAKCNFEAMKVLIELGDPLEAKNFEGTTPLDNAVFSKREDCVKLLLSAGASVHNRNRHRHTPLHHAASRNLLSIAIMLMDAGADPGAKDNSGKIPQAYASDADVRAILKTLHCSVV